MTRTLFRVFDVLQLSDVAYHRAFNSPLLAWSAGFLMKFWEDLRKPLGGLKMVRI